MFYSPAQKSCANKDIIKTRFYVPVRTLAKKALLSEDAARSGLLGSKLGCKPKASGACAKPHIFRRCDGSSFNQEGMRTRAHPPLRSLVCCVDNGTGARSAAEMSTACLRRLSREAATASGLAIVKSFFRGPQHGAFNLRVLQWTESAFPDANCEYRGGRKLSCAHSHKTHLGAHHVCLLRRSHRQHQKALFVRGPFVGRDTFGSERCGHR